MEIPSILYCFLLIAQFQAYDGVKQKKFTKRGLDYGESVNHVYKTTLFQVLISSRKQ